jgi:hypothetical protein
MTIAALSGNMTGTGATSSVSLEGGFNLSLSGFGTATVAAQRSFDGGSTWVTIDSFTSDTEQRAVESESGVLYRLNCTAYTSGTIAYRLSR